MAKVRWTSSCLCVAFIVALVAVHVNSQDTCSSTDECIERHPLDMDQPLLPRANICHSGRGTCVECEQNGDCDYGDKMWCSRANKCVECINDQESSCGVGFSCVDHQCRPSPCTYTPQEPMSGVDPEERCGIFPPWIPNTFSDGESVTAECILPRDRQPYNMEYRVLMCRRGQWVFKEYALPRTTVMCGKDVLKLGIRVRGC